jgi:hypothetical protein
MPQCKKCGKEAEGDAAYCSNCGEPLETNQPQQAEQAPQPEARKPSGVRLAALATVLVVMIVAGAFIALQRYPASPLAVQPTQSLTSSDWSGYSVSTNLKNPQASVTGVSATWTVPAVAASVGASYSAVWVGIGGQYDQSLIQVGTQQDSVFGSANYSAWYELLPDYPVYLGLNISPGDTIRAEIALVSSATDTWSISISDTSTGQTFQTNVVYSSSMLSAEWVVERPLVRSRSGPLADFGSVTITNCSATVSNKRGSITGFPSSKFSMINRMNNDLVSVSPIVPNGGSFTVTFLSSS